MARLTARNAPSRGVMVARNACRRKRPWPKNTCGYGRADDRYDFAARISTTIDWTAGDTAMCLARQAGPGPRM
jgi:hypothetical protein